MSLPHILLGLLRQPASGYDLKNSVDEYVRHFWPAELSQIYPTLKRLESAGWLTVKSEASPRGPERRVYETTEAGHEELQRWLRSGPQVGNERFEYLAQIAFMDELGSLEEARRFMVTLRARLIARRAGLEALETGWSQEWPDFPHDLPDHEFYPHINLRMGLLSLAAKIQWCDESIERIDRRLELLPEGHAKEPLSAKEGS